MTVRGRCYWTRHGGGPALYYTMNLCDYLWSWMQHVWVPAVNTEYWVIILVWSCPLRRGAVKHQSQAPVFNISIAGIFCKTVRVWLGLSPPAVPLCRPYHQRLAPTSVWPLYHQLLVPLSAWVSSPTRSLRVSTPHRAGMTKLFHKGSVWLQVFVPRAHSLTKQLSKDSVRLHDAREPNYWVSLTTIGF